MQQFIVKMGEEQQKLGNYLKKKMPNVSLSLIHKVFRKNDVKVNGTRTDKEYLVQVDDLVQVYLPDFLFANDETIIRRVTPTFEIIYEDSYILIVNKPVGLLTTEDKEEKVKTLANQVVSYYLTNGLLDETLSGFIPVPVHRLDRNTSGLVVIAKTVTIAKIFTDLFRNRQGIEKCYIALVKGLVKEPGEINLPLLKDAKTNTVKVSTKEIGLSATTLYSPIETYHNFTLLNVVILTGRTHQIRVHMQAIGHPVIGDAKYGDFATNRQIKSQYNYENQFLHAGKLRFGKLPAPLDYLSYKEFEAPLSKSQQLLLDNLNKN